MVVVAIVAIVILSAGFIGYSIINSGPENAVEQYRTGLYEKDVEMANDVIHPDGELSKFTHADSRFVGRTQTSEITKISLEEYRAQEDPTITRAEIENIKRYQLSQMGSDEFALVRCSLESGAAEKYYAVHKIGGEWYVVDVIEGQSDLKIVGK